MRVCTFQAENVTGCGSEGVNMLYIINLFTFLFQSKKKKKKKKEKRPFVVSPVRDDKVT